MNDDRKSHGALLALTCIVVVLLPLVYVLSIGPAAYLVTTERLSLGQYISAYRPLIWLAERWDAFNDGANWYVHLWIDEEVLRERES